MQGGEPQGSPPATGTGTRQCSPGTLESMHAPHEHFQMLDALVATLASAIEGKDPYAHGNAQLVAHHAVATARELGLDAEQQRTVYYAALLHDVGKIGISEGILYKPGPLFAEELAVVQAHARLGYDLLCNVPGMESVARAVLHHHEWYDGSGYPDRLREEEIPVAARIVAVVDAYNGMTSKRSYKSAYTEEHARAELRRHSGTQFDPRIVVAFLNALEGITPLAEPVAI